MQLEDLGWNGFFASQQFTGVPGRVATVSHDRFLVWTEAGAVQATASGNLRHSGTVWPAVGDWVALRPGSPATGLGRWGGRPDAPVIEQLFDRRTVLSRKRAGRAIEEQVLAANIDVLFVVSGLDGDFNQRRIERYLVVAHQSGARPVILLNKADLARNDGLDLAAVVSGLERSSGVPVRALSALAGNGLSGLGELVRSGETAALIGSSGVGKSTIVNALLGEARQATRAVRSSDDRGRHTTTARSLFVTRGGWLLIDTPGLREVQLWASAQQLDAGFDDVRQLARTCRFRDCTHCGEPGCAVEASGLDAERLENYRKMQREIDYLERKADKRLMSETRARWKAIHKAMRTNPKPKW